MDSLKNDNVDNSSNELYEQTQHEGSWTPEIFERTATMCQSNSVRLWASQSSSTFFIASKTQLTHLLFEIQVHFGTSFQNFEDLIRKAERARSSAI